MQDFQQIEFIGRVGADVRTFGEGDHAGCSFPVATNNSKKGEDGWTDKTMWVNVSAYGKLGEYAKNTFSKGSKLLVVGRLDTREYEKDGQTRTSLEVKASQIINLTPKPVSTDGTAPF